MRPIGVVVVAAHEDVVEPASVAAVAVPNLTPPTEGMLVPAETRPRTAKEKSLSQK